MSYQDAGLIFEQFDSLAQAKLATVFAVHLAGLVILFRMASSQPTSFLHRAPYLVGSWSGSLTGAMMVATLVAAASFIVGRQSGLVTVLFLNAGVLSLYVIEFTVLLSRGFFRRLLDDELQPEIRVAIAFIVMVNAGYFTLMLLKDILLSDQLGVR
ncbi:MAG: hypothetical protein ACON37_04075 [Candidatus Puniceispirillaceae bacterium]